jgi:hypothetical protein
LEYLQNGGEQEKFSDSTGVKKMRSNLWRLTEMMWTFQRENLMQDGEWLLTIIWIEKQ